MNLGSASRRSLLERLIARGAPSWVAAHEPPPREIAPGLWSVDRLLGIPLGPRLGTRSLLVDLPGGGVLAWSPVPLDDALRSFVAARGGARFLVAPSSFHYLGLTAWQRAFPDAAIWLAPGLRARKPEVPAGDELLPDAATPFAKLLPHSVLDCGRGVTEVAFLHAPSRTLILVDTAFNLPQAARRRDRFGLWLLGLPSRFGPTRSSRLILLRDRAAIRAWIDALCAWDFSRIVMAHGDSLDAGPHELRAAFAQFLE
ncbi:MAG TPA: DUF4336 domain-containing protein [Myxococcota bacterium]|nr:DUF4336 domain-containing protein [Myxococcota bacterium]